MSRQVEARANVEFRLPEPVQFTGTFTGSEVEGVLVQFDATHCGPRARVPNHHSVTAVLFAEDHSNTAISRREGGEWTPPLPDWCPKPPEGWDAHVRAFRERVEAEVVAR